MRSKFVAIIAASAAALGSTMLSAPAHAQVSGTSDVGVNVTVPEVLYLRTVQTIDISLLPADLTAAPLTASGSGFFGSDATGTADGTNGVDTTSPFFLTGGNVQVTKQVPAVFAVWSNSPRGNGVAVTTSVITNTLNGASGATIAINGVAPIQGTANVPGLVNPFVSGVDLDLILGGNGISQAGAYTGGVIRVTATAP
ncbi:hypothetical protein ACQFX9_15115 [Aliinostoc sp. HNIBRCY26]|uniref:hypothetical protein n=1 Tax=Aliinostoc sp. HNIBRCY26 TaxID=3418997 RepID=UPI003D07D6B0